MTTSHAPWQPAIDALESQQGPLVVDLFDTYDRFIGHVRRTADDNYEIYIVPWLQPTAGRLGDYRYLSARSAVRSVLIKTRCINPEPAPSYLTGDLV